MTKPLLTHVYETKDTFAVEYRYDPVAEILTMQSYALADVPARPVGSMRYQRSTWEIVLTMDGMSGKPCRFKKFLRQHNLQYIPL